MNNETITTKRLILRRFKIEDCEVFHSIFSDPEVMKFWSTAPYTSMTQTEDFILKTIAAVESGDGDDFVILYHNNVVGKAGIWNKTEIGFILAKEVWGLGIATEAVRAVLKRARDRGMLKIHAGTDPHNVRSINVLKKCGFIETRREKNTMVVGGVLVDTVFFEIDLSQPETRYIHYSQP